MSNVSLIINGANYEVPSNLTVLEAARTVGIDIPTLCFLKDINEVGACRVCVVEVEGARALQASCVLPVREGMVVNTNTGRVRNARKNTVELLLANHNRECTTCVRSKNCELQSVSEELGIRDIRFEGAKREPKFDDASYSIVRDSSKCILCGRCVSACKNVQGIGILDFLNRGFDTTVGPAFEMSMNDAPCIYCGQCMVVCPVGALSEKSGIDRVWSALEDKSKHVIVQSAPAVRAALGEEFGYEIGTNVTGKLATALRKLGFAKIFDTNWAADVTIMEEGTELLGRLKNGGKLPMITSCSPGWVRYIEFNYPDLLEHLSSCKSPQNMFGALAKSYYAEKHGIDPKDIVVVSVMPCTSKKSEIERPELSVNGLQDVDISITTRELARMIKEARIEFDKLEEGTFDAFMGDYSGAGVIFGATGGVMEAALRTVADVLTGQDLENVDYTAVRGIEGIKEATVNIAGTDVKIAVAHNTTNAGILLDKIRAGEADYHFIEIMACPGGCVNGGGQPIQPANVRNVIDLRAERAKALYSEDASKAVRKSHKNPEIKKLYDEYLGEPNSHKAHELLHTHYYAREQYPIKK
ncbi:NADH-dependent [FeFe] hydrogenase, group A6 [Fusibacter ferrireducens]|uniref:Iron hydrogenase small subunit n=1 Tax=Fusibacter ferrireducens TaxID=2785058 RepID=A0ABR9ZY42_9FIRM|nr:NADH-dependent [FeFe] hydrogenase, group A6 [Fusibacter ferrireducens]MBF4695372.1 iron hydrogenase small subunit [Fusibacter ferrireducens]